MTKTNYTKVEEILEQGLRKMSINKIFEDSEKAIKQKGESKPESDLDKEKALFIANLKRDLKKLDYRAHMKFYSSLGMKKSELKKKIAAPNLLKPEDWEAIMAIKKKIDLYKAQLSTQIPEMELSQAIDEERTKHINKRFNVNEKWLPLH